MQIPEESLTAICSHIDLDISGAALMHCSNNALFYLPAEGVVVRILRSRTMTDRPAKVARLGQWLNHLGETAPAIRLWPEVPQPVVVGDHYATIWFYESPSEPQPTASDLGRTLKRWHSLRPPSGLVPSWDPVTPARQRIADATRLTSSVKRYLIDWCDRLQPHVEELNRGHICLIHGDAHVGNLIRTRDGNVVLCDFDSTSMGPFQVDLAAAAAAATWFHDERTHRLLATAYGYEVTADPLWDLFRSTRELAFVVGGAPHLDNPAIAEEFALRLESVQTGNNHTPWTPYADLHSTLDLVTLVTESFC
ncbi:aminoglycoside phosphotransferase family protein [Natronoglycomyces albus]|uniref:Aminoglycoside phosphotransferase family protein n=1 Tax=Natronoglycomyces albus TaxID=2811108 RepID=A0A895XU47_9ACTN|nr:aminoglycoside phosphotransferase family protein [Natronoglycomyces albus]QSB06046.1 aminoglycoside phosphotransferase family protein [Natronoglycomyces albus]